MTAPFRAPFNVLRKLHSHLRLLRDDPERFARNVQQFTNPARFREQLEDVLVAPPLFLRVEPGLAPALNVLRPPLSPQAMTGGPNTVVNLAYWIALRGVPVRLIAAPPGPGADLAWFWQHLATVTGATERPPTLTVVAAHDPAQPSPIGQRDMFLATHWTTAEQVGTLLPRMSVPRFFYLIQDFEPGFYPWSSNYALALATYGSDHIGIFNEALLRDYFVQQRIGRYGDAACEAHSLVFEPAIDRVLFCPGTVPPRPGPRRLLFYARPTNPRNLFGLGLAALRRAIGDPAFRDTAWEFVAIGSRGSLPELPLGNGQVLRPAPWQDYAAYAAALREADILLCPMLSPHTSYPVLEMAACGGRVVTNTFATKTAERLAAMSPHIVAVLPTVDGLRDGLIAAAGRGRRDGAGLDLPADWRTSLDEVAASVTRTFQAATEAG